MNDFRFYKVTIGCDKSSIERFYKVIALEPNAAVEIATRIATKDKWPIGSTLAAIKIVLVDKRIKN